MTKPKSGLNFSPKQLEALDLTKQNMLVSAGAGSGKTAVLVERLYQIITEKEVPLDRLLVLTFTEAGAQEFKNRIKVKLNADSVHSHKAFGIDTADITTFDAYALKLLKKYGYLLNLDANVTNLDENIEQVLMKRSFDNMMVSEYENPSEALKTFAKRFLVADDFVLFKAIYAFHRTTKLVIDPELFVATYEQNYYSPAKFNEYMEAIDKEVILLLRAIAADVKALQNEKFVARYETFLNTYGDILSLKDYLAKKESLKKQKAPNHSKEEFPEDVVFVERINKTYKRLDAYESLGTREKIHENFLEDQKIARFLISLYEKLMVDVNAYKQTHNAFTFADVARHAFKLINVPAVQQELKTQYDYILIDEYQDTSDIQEAFIQTIANNNVYMVGDIKQSIYGFRNANSDIFREKYALFAHGKGGKLVDLNDNYRSRSAVLTAINAMLSELMSDTIGGANYAKDHLIGYGNKAYDKHVHPDQKVGLVVLNYQKPEKDKDGQEPNQKLPLSAQEIEAEIVIKDIKEKMATGYQVFDPSIKALRPIEYRDFTILISRKTHFATIEKRFIGAAIPLYVSQDEDTSSEKVNIALKSLLRIYVSYAKEDIPKDYDFRFAVASFLRSFVNNYTDQALLDLMGHKQIDYRHDPVLARVKKIVTSTKEYPVIDIVNALVCEFDLYGAIYKIGDVTQNTLKLTATINQIANYAALNHNLEDILAFLSEAKEIEAQEKLKRPKLIDNAVSLMSIHHSKGLEFPIVYYIDIGQDFFRAEKQQPIKSTRHVGFVFPLYGNKLSMNGFLAEAQATRALLSERIRLLYVALTRARELMVIVHPVYEKLDQLPSIADSKTFVQLLLNSTYYRDHIEVINFEETRFSQTLEIPPFSGPPIELKTLSYPFKQKDRVYALFGDRAQNDILLRRGTQLHHYIEHFDFDTRKFDYIHHKDDRNHLKKLFALPLFEGTTNENVYREYAYIDEKTNQTFAIDFFILKSRKITLVDFKLVNINEESYDLQVKNYARYLQNTFKRPVEAYLVSIINLDYRKVVTNE